MQHGSLQYAAQRKVRNGRRYGTALPTLRERGNEIEFQPAAMTTLIYSPVSAGAHYKTFELGSVEGAQHYLHVAADSDRALEAPPEVIANFSHLVRETVSPLRMPPNTHNHILQLPKDPSRHLRLGGAHPYTHMTERG